MSKNINVEPSHLKQKLSAEAFKFIEESVPQNDSLKIFDYHVHLLGLGQDDSGIYVNKRLMSLFYPLDYLKTRTFLGAGGVKDEKHADQEYVDRLVTLVKNNPTVKNILLLPLDHYYGEDGLINLEKTQFYVPNEYVFTIAKRYPEYFTPAISVHPYRKDAVTELEKWHTKGVRIVKWIPNTMGFDPSDSRCDPFYKKMAELDMILFSHTGDEKAVKAINQEWGNPLLLRRPLDHGIKVIAVHCASLGKNSDKDKPFKKESNFKLFLRMMDDDKYKNHLFGEISALTQVNRLPEPLTIILERTDLHNRLINGSDYPLPAVDALINTKKLAKLGFITKEEQRMLDEIFSINPLLFDYMVKRTVRHPKTGKQFSSRIFEMHPLLQPM